MSTIIGIDLGTTNSACAVLRNGVATMIPNALGHVLTPSAVSVDEHGEVLTGLAARERQSSHADRTVTAFKRLMGTRRITQLGRLSFLPEELSALVLRSLKRDAELFLGVPVTEAVITVPAYFNDKQRRATRRAGELAGFSVERLINEPTAAALAHGIHQRDAETRFLVFDLGGGTFDVSVVDIFDGVIEVRASAGDNRLGGEDFNEVVIGIATAALSGRLGRRPVVEGPLYQRLREAAERTRRSLTDSPRAAFQVTWEGVPLEAEIRSEEFEAACAPLLERMRDPVLRSLRDSSIDVHSLDEIVLVGGATRMPVVRRTVTRMFGRFPGTSVDPDEAVARGAAIQAALKGRDAALRELVVTDVCPYSLGVEASERHGSNRLVKGLFVPILERNCVVPASREDVFSAIDDDQAEVEFQIYQGESRWVRDNVQLGTLRIPVPRGRATRAPVRCRFSYDINGILEVDLHVPETGERRQLVLIDDDTLSADQISIRREALAAIKVHPRDTAAIAATLARAGRCYEHAIGEQRAAIGDLISRFEAVVEGQDPRACEAARAELSAALDAVEGPTTL